MKIKGQVSHSLPTRIFLHLYGSFSKTLDSRFSQKLHFLATYLLIFVLGKLLLGNKKYYFWKIIPSNFSRKQRKVQKTFRKDKKNTCCSFLISCIIYQKYIYIYFFLIWPKKWFRSQLWGFNNFLVQRFFFN